ncbi:hypothetical protein ACS0TY_002805 [Phlomoides rotata]
MARTRKANHTARNTEEEEPPYTTQEMEEYVNFVCDDEEEIRDHPSRYRIKFGEKIWEYIDIFIHSLKMTIKPTKYLDEECIEALGIKDDVYELFGNTGWNDFIAIKKPNYRDLIMEVLITVEVPIDDDGMPIIMEFQLGN